MWAIIGPRDARVARHLLVDPWTHTSMEPPAHEHQDKYGFRMSAGYTWKASGDSGRVYSFLYTS